MSLYFPSPADFEKSMDMHYLLQAGMSREEVALAYGLSKASIYSRMSRLRRSIEHWLRSFIIPHSNIAFPRSGPLDWPDWQRKLMAMMED